MYVNPKQKKGIYPENIEFMELSPGIFQRHGYKTDALFKWMETLEKQIRASLDMAKNLAKELDSCWQ